MKKLLALALSLWTLGAAAQDIPNHSVPIGGGAGAVGFRSAGPCPANQTLLWVSGTGADPTCGLSASNITVGTTSIGGGVSGRVLFDNAGILGEYPITGTAGNVVLSVGPTFTGTIIASAGTVSGSWTFNGLANFTSTFQIGGTTQSFPASGLLVGTTDSQTLTNKSIDGSEINSGTIVGARVTPISLGSSANGGVTGTLGYANGGCNATTQGGCTNNIFPGPTRSGDIVYWNGSTWVTLPGNNSGTQVLQETSSGIPSWVTISGTGTVTSVAFSAGLAGSTITTAGTGTLDGNYTGWALSNCTLAASVGSSLLTVALKDNAGNDPSGTSPCNLNYRNATASTGSLTLVQQTTAISISTNATGATLGSVANTAFRFWVVVFNNAGTNVLALFNAWDGSSIQPLNEGVLATSTPISGSATSAGVFYSPNGTTVTSKAYRILGYIEYNSSGLVTPGTYASGPNFIQVFGPGIRKPGEPIQILTNTTTTAGSTSSATFAALATGQSKAIIPTSAANPIRVFTQGTVVANVNANVGLQVARNSTLIGNPAAINITSGGASQVLSILTYDFPNTTSSVTYQYQGKTGGGTMNYPAGATGSVLEVQEIQG